MAASALDLAAEVLARLLPPVARLMGVLFMWFALFVMADITVGVGTMFVHMRMEESLRGALTRRVWDGVWGVLAPGSPAAVPSWAAAAPEVTRRAPMGALARLPALLGAFAPALAPVLPLLALAVDSSGRS